jgi:hypothetical protein
MITTAFSVSIKFIIIQKFLKSGKILHKIGQHKVALKIFNINFNS